MLTITKKNLLSCVVETTQTTQTKTNAIIQSFFGEIVTEFAKGNRRSSVISAYLRIKRLQI
jgi:nucleoid DNA-binding protein